MMRQQVFLCNYAEKYIKNISFGAWFIGFLLAIQLPIIEWLLYMWRRKLDYEEPGCNRNRVIILNQWLVSKAVHSQIS